MSYEVGKAYTFTQNEFVPSRETGKLYFNIGENGDGKTYRVTPFDFQINNIPEQIVCIYRENDRFEQSLASVLDKVYAINETYQFKVLRANPSCMTLRDEVNGLTHNRIFLPYIKVNRYDKIRCRVCAITPEGLQLSYESNDGANNNTFQPEEILNLSSVKGKRWEGVLMKLFNSELMSEARERAEENSDWLLMAATGLLRYIPHWLSEAPGRRRIWLVRMFDIIREVSEAGRFISTFPKKSGEGYRAREVLTTVMTQLEHLIEASTLVASGRAEEMLEQTLHAMRDSGWIYKPSERIGALMSVLSIAPRYAHSHISEIFEIIKARHLNVGFMKHFGTAFTRMLSLYIDNNRTLMNTADRDSMRELAEAIAIELLLLKELGISGEGDRHRGLLYTISALLTGISGGRAVKMGLLSFAGINDTRLEFDWDDLKEINRVCYQLIPHSKMTPSEETAIFEGENVRLRVKGNTISVMPAWSDLRMRPVLKRKLGGIIDFNLFLPNRLRQRVELANMNLTNHHLLWNEVYTSLRERADAVGDLERRKGNILVGQNVNFIVTGSRPENKYDFQCLIIDEDDNRTPALMQLTDVVPYPVGFSTAQQIFNEDGSPMLLSGYVTDILSDGTPRLSMRKIVMEINASDAKEDMEEEKTVLAMVSDVRGTQYKATTEYGYGVLISKEGVELEEDDIVNLCIENVNLRRDSDKLYINARFLDFTEDESCAEMLEMSNKEYSLGCLRELLSRIADGRTYEIDEVPEVEAEDDEEDEEGHFLLPEALDDISMLLERCASIRHANLVDTYSDLAVARLLAEAAGDRVRNSMLELRMSLQEAISTFARNGRLDSESAGALIERCNREHLFTRDMAMMTQIITLLAGMDNSQFLEHRFINADGNETVAKLRSIVTAYNLIDGLGMPEVRTQLRGAVYKLLSLPEPRIEKNRLPVKEDLYHEFKTSLIYPAANNMQPDENKQGEVIVQGIAAFLNAEGGTLYLGVDDGGYTRGLNEDFRYLSRFGGDYDIREVQDKFRLMIQSHLRRLIGTTIDGISLFPDYLRIEFEENDKNCICRLVVNKFPGAVLFKDGRLFIRKDGEKNEIRDSKEIRRFCERRSEKMN